MKRGLLFFSLLLLVACSQKGAPVSSTATPLPTQTLPSPTPPPPKVTPSYTPAPESLLPDSDIGLYILIDNSPSSINFKEREKIAGFFFTMSKNYLQTHPKVYWFGCGNFKPLTEYDEIMKLARCSPEGDLYADALKRIWEQYISKETKKQRVLIMITEGSFNNSLEIIKLSEKVRELVINLLEKNDKNVRLYFLVDADSFESWKNLYAFKFTDVLQGSGPELPKSIKKIGEEIFDPRIKWLFAGESAPLPRASFRQQLSAVLLNPEEDKLRVILRGGGFRPLSGEQNFRYDTYDWNELPESLELISSSQSGIVAYWTTEIPPSISVLALDRRKCSSSGHNRCLELKLKLSSNSDMRPYIPKLELKLGGENKEIRGEKINSIGGNEYTVEWRVELEDEPEKIFFFVEDADGKTVLTPTPIPLLPLIMDMDIRNTDEDENNFTYTIITINFWFVPDKSPKIHKILSADPVGSECESEKDIDVGKKEKEEKGDSFWDYKQGTKSAIEIWLRNAKRCNIQGVRVIFEIENSELEFKCDLDGKCNESLIPKARR